MFNELERNADKVERLIEKDTDVEDVQLLNQVTRYPQMHVIAHRCTLSRI